MKLTLLQNKLKNEYLSEIEQQAKLENIAIGACKNKKINEILNELNEHYTSNKATYETYLKVYNRLINNNKNVEKSEINLLLHKAKTRATYDLYRTSLKFGLINEIKELQKKSDYARKNKKTNEMIELTNKAFDLAIVLKDNFELNKESIIFERVNSKRKTLNKMPKLKNILKNMDKVCVKKYKDILMVYDLFGLRPAEFKKGVSLKLKQDENGENVIEATISGAKIGKHSGQDVRICTTTLEKDNELHQEFYKNVFRQQLRNGGVYKIEQNEKTYKSLSKFFYRKYGTAVSLYSFRHKVASDLKRSKTDEDTIAAFLGHRVDKSQTYYGNYQKGGSGGRKFEATATHKIKHTKNYNFDFNYNNSNSAINKYRKNITILY
ncbi:hypothetical protein A9G24_02000 [Gilliamella sp. App6-5]|uniref:hypothetical protein n=1 Tax=Gilliamella sp. App6-5 TaxID=3120232 RepID=UPI00080EA79D|nr:hypothetical protein [Gilliamella apicola]OCG11953.1 hypothetical protein A9G24_02000 [Gilliamella apicola]